MQFNDTIPLTPDAFYDGLLKLGREITWKIYKEFSYFKIFDELKEKNATKDDVFNFMLWTNQSLINQAVRIFIDRLDTDP